MKHSLFKDIIKNKLKKIKTKLSEQKNLFAKKREDKDNLYNMQRLCDMTVIINEKNIDKVVTLLIETRSIIIADRDFFEICNVHCKNLQRYGINICCSDANFNDYKSYENGVIMILSESAQGDAILSNIKNYNINPVVIKKFKGNKKNNLLELFFLNEKNVHINLCVEALFNCITMGVISRKINDFGEMIN